MPAGQEPRFDATDPNAYPPGVWAPYDLIAKAAPALGMKVYFELNPPAPAWATPNRRPAQGYAWSQTPDTRAYHDFVIAAGRRYSGSFKISGAETDHIRALTLPILPGSGSANPSAATSNMVPRVDYWGIWNEPNEAAWLNPQWNHVSGTRSGIVGVYQRYDYLAEMREAVGKWEAHLAALL